MFGVKKKIVTDTYSQFGIPGNFFKTSDCRLKIIIDPPKNYFIKQLLTDKKSYDKLLLIHGCETPDLNEISKEVIAYNDHFTKIYSFDKNVIEKVKTAEKFEFGSCWVLTDAAGKLTNSGENYKNCFNTSKEFKLSFIKSNKSELPGHKIRQPVSELLNIDQKFKVYFPKERIETKMSLFIDSMFHVAIENSRYDNYFTEKLVDCFMSYTIPIYWGAPDIGNIFDKNGIITFNNIEELKVILDELNPDFYKNRLESIKKNYQIAFEKYAFFFEKINSFIDKL